MLSKVFLTSVFAATSATAFKTNIDHNQAMTQIKMTDVSYSTDAFGKLVDSVLDACDSNGCDVNTKKCDNAFCISVDGDNFDQDTNNIKQVVGDFVKKTIQTNVTTDSWCTSSGCQFDDAHIYKIPSYVSLARDNDNGTPNALYKISVTGSEDNNACNDVFGILTSVAGLFDGGSLLGIAKVIACP